MHIGLDFDVRHHLELGDQFDEPDCRQRPEHRPQHGDERLGLDRRRNQRAAQGCSEREFLHWQVLFTYQVPVYPGLQGAVELRGFVGREAETLRMKRGALGTRLVFGYGGAGPAEAAPSNRQTLQKFVQGVPFGCALISSNLDDARSNLSLKSHIASRISRKLADVFARSTCPNVKMLLLRK
jgi:hypothetical protein